MSKSRSTPQQLATDAVSDLNSEIEAIMREAEELERQGKLDDAAKQRMDARIQQTFADSKQQLKDRVAAEVQASHARPPQSLVSKSFRISVVVLILLMLVGVLLEISVGRGFVFSATTEYRTCLPRIAMVLVPAFAAFWLFVEKRKPFLRRKRCPSAICALVGFPMLVAMSFGLVVVTPLGWAALLGWATGDTHDNLDGTIVTMAAAKPTARGCRQSADLEYRGAVCTICLDGRIVGPKPSAGDHVVLTGRTSRFGLYIDQVRIK